MQPSFRGFPPRSRASTGACSIASVMRWPERPPWFGTHRPAASRRTRMAAAKSFWCSTACFRASPADYPAGSYVRNPSSSRHTPGSASGCVLFVKLWQFDLKDRTPVRRDGRALVYTHAQDRPGVEIAPLFRDNREEVRMERWAPNTSVTLGLPDGGEFLVVDGALQEGGERFAPQSWLRLPPQGRLSATVGRHGCTLWVKTGHLRHIQVPPRTGE